jgi:hypothetical protein
LWTQVKQGLIDDLKSIKIGPTDDLSNFFKAVIDEKSFDKIAKYIANAKESKDVEIVAGGNCDKTNGYFIEPTVLIAKDPQIRNLVQRNFWTRFNHLCLRPKQVRRNIKHSRPNLYLCTYRGNYLTRQICHRTGHKKIEQRSRKFLHQRQMYWRSSGSANYWRQQGKRHLRQSWKHDKFIALGFSSYHKRNICSSHRL